MNHVQEIAAIVAAIALVALVASVGISALLKPVGSVLSDWKRFTQ
jgi:uncharacterized protein YoxC